MNEMMKAPTINYWIHVLRGGEFIFNDETTKTIDNIFEQLGKIAPCGDDGKRELWLKAERGTIEDYDDFEYLKEEEIVESYEDFTRMWLEEYPDEINWFHMVSFEREDYRALFLGRKIIYQSRVFNGHQLYDASVNDLFVWMEDAIKNVIETLKNGTYNEDVRVNLPAKHRTGTIARKDYWEAFPDDKKYYLKDITQGEIDQFVSYINEQTDDKPVGEYLLEMTAGKFYECCAIGYKANNYENLEGLTPKEQYYRNADGRDEGLSEINSDSAVEFEEWYNDKSRYGGHPWEVCRGGNSTHIDLYVLHNEHGYYLSIAGKAWTRSIEAIKFYNALRAEGVAVYLHDAKSITRRLLGEDEIGIVPENVSTAYCESWFPAKGVIDFMHLPYEKDENELMLPKVRWFEEEKQRLIEERKL